MLSQICYTARCYKPSTSTLDKLEDLICCFLNYGTDHFSRANIFKHQGELGLGIPKLKPFCSSQLEKNASRALNSMQPWAISVTVIYNYWNQKPERRVIGATGSVYVKDMGGELSNLALNYYRVSRTV